MSASIGELIDEAIGIKGPEDLLKLVLSGVSVAILIVGWFMTRMEPWSLHWWTLLGFEAIALCLCAVAGYVVLIVLPAVSEKDE